MMREGADKTVDGKSFGPMMSKLGEYYACGPAVDLSVSKPNLPSQEAMESHMAIRVEA